MSTELKWSELRLKIENDPSRSPLTPDFTAGVCKDLDSVLDYLKSDDTQDTISRDHFDRIVNTKIDAAL